MEFLKKKIREYNYILDFCNNHIKIIRSIYENGKKGKSIIDKIFTLNLEKMSEEKINNFFGKLLTSTEKSNLITFIPRKDTTVKYIRLPSDSPDEVANMIEFQIDKEIPYPALEISYDYRIFSVDKEGYSNVMVAIAYKKKVATVIDNFKNYGLTLDSIALDVDSLCNWFNYTYGILDRPVGVVDIDMHKINLIVVREGVIDFSRSVPIGNIDLDGGENRYVIVELGSEILRSIAVYEKNKVTEVNRLIITGAEDSFEYLKQELEKEFQGNLEVKSCFEKVPLAFASEKLKKQGARTFSFAYLIGAALPFQQKRLEFLPQEIMFEKEIEIKKNIMKKIGILSLSIVLVNIAVIGYRFYLLHTNLVLVDSRLKEITPEVEKVKQEVSIMRRLSGYLQDRDFSLDILREVYVRIPETASLTRLELNRDNNLILRGETERISDVFSFVSSLEKSPYFSQINADSVTVIEKADKEIVSFELYCKIK